MRISVQGHRHRHRRPTTWPGSASPFEQMESQHAKTQQGTGLGLALTKALVELHGGVFELESAPGEGTTASFVLPAYVKPSRLRAERAA